MKKTYIISITIFMSIMLFCACEQNKTQKQKENSEPGYPVKLFDAHKKEVIVLKKPLRIVIAGTSLYSEILISLGMKDYIVGIAESKNNPIEVQNIPSIGKPLQPNLETIISLQPDIVFGVSSNEREKIELAGIPVFIVGKAPFGVIDSLQELYKAIENIDMIMSGNYDKSEQIVKDIKATLQDWQNKIPETKPKKVAIAYVSSKNPPFVVGHNSLENELLQMAKADNVFSISGQTSVEIFFKANPDIIITDPAQIDLFYSEEVWQQLDAVKNKKVFAINASHWSSSNIAKTFEELIKILYPEAF